MNLSDPRRNPLLNGARSFSYLGLTWVKTLYSPWANPAVVDVENLGGVPPAFESRGQKAQPEVLHPLAPFVAPPPAIRQHHLAHGQTSATSRTPTGEARIPIA